MWMKSMTLNQRPETQTSPDPTGIGLEMVVKCMTDGLLSPNLRSLKLEDVNGREK